MKKAIKVQYTPWSEHYTYYTYFDVKLGDSVVVPAQDRLKVAQVSELDVTVPDDIPYTIRFVVDVVDLPAHAIKMQELGEALV